MMSVTMQHFVDRIFLTWWSAEAVAGVTTGGFAIYVLTGLFNGTAEYPTPFVSRYRRGETQGRIGAVVYQPPTSDPRQEAVGAGGSRTSSLLRCGGARRLDAGPRDHLLPHHVRGTFPVVLMVAFSTYFAGRGKTRVVLGVTIGGDARERGSRLGPDLQEVRLSEMGTAGAAYTTIIAG